MKTLPFLVSGEPDREDKLKMKKLAWMIQWKRWKRRKERKHPQQP